MHPFQPFILGQKHLAYKLSIRYNIPLVFYGENSAEYNTKFFEGIQASYDTKFCVSDDLSKLYLGGISVEELVNDFGLSYGDFASYLPANTASVGSQKTEVYYLGYYLSWHPQGCFYYAVEHGGFKPSPERTVGTYSKYNSIDDRIIDDFHYYTTYIKFGLGRASYDASQEIRNNEINREEGIALVQKYDGEWPKRFADEIFRYLSIPPEEYPVASKMFEQPIMDKEYFIKLCDNFRSPHLWKRVNGEWRLRHTVFAD
ncbi:MAG: hypothetical protein LBL30_04540 [Holosporales bacterium]|nr:hypothetical protein [Holosporales bacterium]